MGKIDENKKSAIIPLHRDNTNISLNICVLLCTCYDFINIKSAVFLLTLYYEHFPYL